MKIRFIVKLFTIFLIASFGCKIKKKDKTFQQELGHYLFFDTRLSLNNTKSCASCHSPQFAFTDGYRTSITALGENVLHNSPSLINAIFLKKLDWANPNANTFLQQIQRPLYNNHPIELGLHTHIKALQKQIVKDSLYKILFKRAFPNDDSFYTASQVEKAIVAYEQTLISRESQFDKDELTPNAYNGLKLFSSPSLNCIKCHAPPYFTLAAQTASIDSVYQNIGLYKEYPEQDNGLYAFTKNDKDKGKFKIPSLRNVMLTAPYMHDGSMATIEEVIDMYTRGGRNIDYGNHKGDGKLNVNKSPLIGGFAISAQEKKDLIAFLNALTDSSIFYKQQFLNPFHK
jgi:cytochrome c peroxidase